jgi:microcystin-dependent protein
VSIGVNQGAVIGEIRWFAMSTPPEGWLVCNGAAVGTSDYVALFAAIGKTFTPQLTSTDPNVENPEYSDPKVFRLPNLIGKVPWGSTSVGTVIDAGLPNTKGTIVIDLPGGIAPFENSGYGALFNNYSAKSYTSYIGGNGSVTRSSDSALRFDASRFNSIYGNSDTVQPPALCLLPCIRYE